MNIIITGAGRGIGAETVKSLCKRNENHTIITISRDLIKLRRLVEECYDLNPLSKVIPIAFDLTEDGFRDILLPRIINKIDKIDILINNAGKLINKPFEVITREELDEVFETNFYSVFRLIQTLHTYIPRGGHIVNISSMGGFQGSSKYKGLAIYSSSKAALACLTECLAAEMSDKGIKVNCIAPGAVKTEMLKEAFPEYEPIIDAAAMGDFIANFALEGSKIMNGKIIPAAIDNP